MLVNRRTFIVRKPYFEEALGLLVELRQLAKELDPTVVMRVYAIEYGPFDTIAYEQETESLAALEQLIAAATGDTPTAERIAAWFKRWLEITAPGGTNEIWRLAE